MHIKINTQSIIPSVELWGCSFDGTIDQLIDWEPILGNDPELAENTLRERNST